MCELEIFFVFIYLLVGYLSGSIPFGLIFGKMAGHGDIRTQGSGNIGATNMLRIAGKKWALLTLLADASKGAAPVLTASYACSPYAAIALLGAVLGHMFPVWLKFRGGKGVATMLGGLLALNPAVSGFVCAIWLATAFMFRYSSLAALVAIFFAPILTFFVGKEDLLVVVIVFMAAFLVWLKHHENISRLIRGEEAKIGKSSKT